MGGDDARRRVVRWLAKLHAIPRRVYTQSHMEYVVEVILEVWRRRAELGGYDLVDQAPFLRHFTARLKPVARSRGL
jgi:tryptophanase